MQLHSMMQPPPGLSVRIVYLVPGNVLRHTCHFARRLKSNILVASKKSRLYQMDCSKLKMGFPMAFLQQWVVYYPSIKKTCEVDGKPLSCGKMIILLEVQISSAPAELQS